MQKPEPPLPPEVLVQLADGTEERFPADKDVSAREYYEKIKGLGVGRIFVFRSLTDVDCYEP